MRCLGSVPSLWVTLWEATTFQSFADAHDSVVLNRQARGNLGKGDEFTQTQPGVTTVLNRISAPSTPYLNGHRTRLPSVPSAPARSTETAAKLVIFSPTSRVEPAGQDANA